MTDDIERMLATPPPSEDSALLAGLESRVWRRVEAHYAQRRQDRMRLAVLAVALVVGVTNGGVLGHASKPRPSDIQVFSVSPGLLPLTRVEVGG